MVRIAAALCVLVVASGAGLWARQSPPAPSAPADTIRLGRRAFEQRCSVCHTIPGPRRYAPLLHQELVTGREDGVRQYITNGSRRMPGFKYGLRPAEIDAIVAYLKTAPKPLITEGVDADADTE